MPSFKSNSTSNVPDSSNDSDTSNDSDSSNNSDTSESSNSNESSNSENTNSSYESQDNLDLFGQTMNKYNIIYEIGRGADAIVWLAYNIEDSKFYAIKVNEPNEYKRGLEEFKFLKKLPPKLSCFNHLKESFVELVDKKKYACGVFELCTGNLDAIVRKGEFQDGLSVLVVKKIMFQLLTAIKYLHQKMKVYHADIKTDNLLLKGINDMDKDIISQYTEKYKNNKNEDLLVRKNIHLDICTNLIFPHKNKKYIIEDTHILNSFVSLSDFGAWCGEEEHYDTDFGTRYYRAPEIILLGTTGYPVDIWAAGCVFYELLTGRILFDPEKDSTKSRDEFHLFYINSLCGNFNIGFLKKTKEWKKYFTSEGKLKNFNKLDEKDFGYLLNKYDIKENQSEILDLLKGMLTISPNERFNVDKCLSSSFFKGISLEG
jgi:serine/threonine protein kinase